MTRKMEAPGARLALLWSRLGRSFWGRRLFSWLLGRSVPYTGSIGAVFEELGPGHARVALADRRKLRNHLDCIHAVALTNLGEVTSGAAMLVGLGAGTRGIVTGLDTTYLKKARGRLTAETRVDLPVVAEPRELDVEAQIRDAGGETVAVVTAHWLLSPERAA